MKKSFLICLIAILTLLVPSVFTERVSAAELEVTDPILKAADGTILSSLKAGQQVVLSTTVHNTDSAEMSFTLLLEVRTADGITAHLVWLSAALDADESFDIGLSWMPDESGDYQVRTYAVSDLANPSVLSAVMSSEINVGSSESVTITPTPASASRIAKVHSFSVSDDSEDVYQVIFSLVDEDISEVAADGRVTFTIQDSENKLLYEQGFSVNDDDFTDYQYSLTGATFLGYGWTFPAKDIAQGSGYGTAKIAFTDDNGKTVSSAQNFITIPTAPELTEDEIVKQYEDAFLESATPYNLALSIEGMDVTLIRAGYFTHLELDTWGDEVTHYRADLLVQNQGGERDYFFTVNSHAFVSEKQFETADFLDSTEIDAGALVQGSVLFKASPSDGEITKLIIGEDFVFDLKERKAYSGKPVELTSEDYEQMYLEASTEEVKKAMETSSMEIRILRHGHYTHYEHDTWGDIVTHYRLDIRFKNESSGEQGIPETFLLSAPGKQFDFVESTFEYDQRVQGDTEIVGYLLFDPISDDVNFMDFTAERYERWDIDETVWTIEDIAVDRQ